MFVNHPFIRENKIESRLYQEVIVGSASKKNTLVVAPTALGKTVIAVLLAAHRIEKFPESKILMISTTRPLVNQHANSFKQFLKIDDKKVNVFTGFTPANERAKLWRESSVICATPQVIKNDLASGKYSLDDVSLIVFDEAHRTTGDYPYAYISKAYIDEAQHPLILALTASPGGEEERIKEVCRNLFIENIEIRTESDPDVRHYVKGIEVEWKKVELPTEFKTIKKLLEEVMKKRLGALKKFGISTQSAAIPKKELLELMEKLQNELKENRVPEVFAAVSQVAACVNISHALELLETQGLETLEMYFRRKHRNPSKAVRGLLADKKFRRAVELTYELSGKVPHPKLEALLEVVRANAGSKIIVFSHYRDSARKIVERLGVIEGVRAVRFVGQASKERDEGLSQKRQLEILQRFREGEYNVLVATSVAEEGLDIPNVDLVIFYEPIPSEIRSIQRRGRTGRGSAGRVVVLVAKSTRDEWFYWSSFRKEKRMRAMLEEMKGKGRKVKQRQIGDFI